MAVAQWREDRLPELKKAKEEGRVLLYVDESACYLLLLLANTWAPCGQTPVFIEQAGRVHLSLIAAIAPNGRLYVAGQDQPFTSEDIVASAIRLVSKQTLPSVSKKKLVSDLVWRINSSE
ncbi:hypothetical protein [Spirosoma foliorum]|uniref:hypothetical protein n=1 Tax=Spirosoma foliorum TaxID=2710596 RepID=UPI001C70D5BC|nr:hypothetical protein [Spirosoma foliorum]